MGTPCLRASLVLTNCPMRQLLCPLRAGIRALVPPTPDTLYCLLRTLPSLFRFSHQSFGQSSILILMRTALLPTPRIALGRNQPHDLWHSAFSPGAKQKPCYLLYTSSGKLPQSEVPASAGRPDLVPLLQGAASPEKWGNQGVGLQRGPPHRHNPGA